MPACTLARQPARLRRRPRQPRDRLPAPGRRRVAWPRSALSGHHERLEQPLRNGLAEEEMALLALDRKLDAESRDELDALPPGRDDHGVGRQRAGARSRAPSPAVVGRSESHLARSEHPLRVGERLHDGLRPVEVAVLVTPRSSGERLVRSPGTSAAASSGDDGARRDALRVLDRDVRPQLLERSLGVGGEEIAAGAEAQLDRKVERGLGSRQKAADSRARRQATAVPHCWRTPPGWMPDWPDPIPVRSRTTRPRRAASAHGRRRAR